MKIHNIRFDTSNTTVDEKYIKYAVDKFYSQARRNVSANMFLSIIAAVGATYLTIQLAPLALPAVLLSSKVLFSAYGISTTVVTVTKIALGALGFIITISVFGRQVDNTIDTYRHLFALINTIKGEYRKDTITDLESQLEEKKQEIEELKKTPKEIEEEEEEEINNNDKNIEEPLNNNKKDD